MPLLNGWQVFIEKSVPLLQILWVAGLAVWGLRALIPDLPRPHAGLFLFFAVSLILRLAFLTDRNLPLYFDSAAHYRIIQALTGLLASQPTEWAVPVSQAYYHLGFHTVSAVFSVLFHIPIKDIILLLGQIVLAAMSLPVFWLVKQETDSTSAAFLSAMLAGFGWFMPAHALNWGKYPALTGMLTAQVTLVIGWLYARTRKRYLLGWLALGVLASAFTHTRTLILFAIVFAGWFLAGMWVRSSKIFCAIALDLLLSAFGVAIYLVNTSPLLKLTFDPYSGEGLPLTLTVLLLTPFALWKFPRMAFASLVTAVLMLACQLVPLTLPIYGFQTLLDRPFVEMAFYLPLALLGGLGGAAILCLSGSRFELGKMRGFIILILFMPVTFNVIGNYHFYPSDCCNLVSNDDLEALDWLDKNLPKKAVVLISSTELRVLEVEASKYHPTDAGVWIAPLTGRRVVLRSSDLDFRAADTLKQLCKRGVTHIYVGGEPQSFRYKMLNKRPKWYRPILFLPGAKVYNVAGCSWNK